MNREDFLMLNQNIVYFDSGATTLKPKILSEAISDTNNSVSNELVDLKNGNVWRAPYNYKQFMIEIMNDNPKYFK